MPLTEISIAGFRSIRNLGFPLRRLTVQVWQLGRQDHFDPLIKLIHAAANGTLAGEIARGPGSVHGHTADHGSEKD